MGRYVSDAPIVDDVVTGIDGKPMAKKLIPKFDRGGMRKKNTYYSTSSPDSHVIAVCNDVDYIYTTTKSNIRKYNKELGFVAEKYEASYKYDICENSKGIYVCHFDTLYVKRYTKGTLVNDVTSPALVGNAHAIICTEDYVYVRAEAYIYKLNATTLAIVSSIAATNADYTQGINFNEDGDIIYISGGSTSGIVATVNIISPITLATIRSIGRIETWGDGRPGRVVSYKNYAAFGLGQQVDYLGITSGEAIDGNANVISVTITSQQNNTIRTSSLNNADVSLKNGPVGTPLGLCIIDNYVIALMSQYGTYGTYIAIVDIKSGIVIDALNIDFSATYRYPSSMALSPDNKTVYFQVSSLGSVFQHQLFSIDLCWDIVYVTE